MSSNRQTTISPSSRTAQSDTSHSTWPNRENWQRALPANIRHYQQRWHLKPVAGDEGPLNANSTFPGGQTGAWVAPCQLPDGTAAVLKLAFPHYESAHEIEGLHTWGGVHSVRLLQADKLGHAMVLERCLPGSSLAAEPPERQDQVLARLLPKLWSLRSQLSAFRPLSGMIALWCDQAERTAQWPNAALGRRGIAELRALAGDSVEPKLLATDLHAGNVLRAERKEWLAIDPKPFVGDPAYDATQHLLNHLDRLATEPKLALSFAAAAGVDPDRVRRWLFGRLAALAGPNGKREQAIARLLESSH